MTQLSPMAESYLRIANATDRKVTDVAGTLRGASPESLAFIATGLEGDRGDVEQEIWAGVIDGGYALPLGDWPREREVSMLQMLGYITNSPHEDHVEWETADGSRVITSRDMSPKEKERLVAREPRPVFRYNPN